MAVAGRSMREGEGARRYPVVGGVAAWRVPLFTALIAFGALGIDAPEVAIVSALVGWAAHGLSRSVTIEVSAAGLARGLVLRKSFVGRSTVIGWQTVADVHTDWCRPGDDSALETTVRGGDGTTIRLSTAMGLAAYWACLADIVRHAPAPTSTGLTAAVLADGPPARRHVLSVAATTSALALIIVAVVLVHYVWSHGRSTLARYLEQETAGAPRP